MTTECPSSESVQTDREDPMHTEHHNINSALKQNTVTFTPKLTKRHRRRTLCPAKHVDKTLTDKLNNAENTLDLILNEQADHEVNIISKLEDAKVSIKNELKHHIAHKIEAMQSGFENLGVILAKLDKTVSCLLKDNHSLKTCLGTVQSEIKQIINRPLPTKSVGTQYDCPDVCVTEQSVDDKHTSVFPSHAPPSPASPVFTTDHGVASSHPSPAPPVPSPVVTAVHGDASTRPLPLRDTGGDGCLVDISQPLSSTHDSDTVSITVPCQNRFDVLSNINQDKERIEISQKGSLSHTLTITNSEAPPHYNHESTQHSTNKKQSDSPEQVLRELTIPRKTSSLLIGDSVIRYINPKRLETYNDPLFKICVPGLTVQDLVHWLRGQEKQDQVNTVIVHVGVNDCPAGPIQPQQWHELINLCRSCFPSAYIAISSIIPARGRHHLNNVIAPSNRNLYAACTKLQVDMIDNFKAFVTPNGAPRQALYKDVTHPSVRGTVCLALLFKQVLPQNRHPRVDDPLDSEGPSSDLPYPRRVQPSSSSDRKDDTRYSHPRPRGDSQLNTESVPILSTEEFPMLHTRKSRQAVSNKTEHFQEATRCDPRSPELLEDSSRNASHPAQNSQPQGSGKLRWPLNVPPVLPHFPPPFIYPSYGVPDSSYPRLPVPFPYPPHGAHRNDFINQQQALCPSGSAGPGYNPLPQGGTANSRSWLQPSPMGDCAQQMMNLASQLMSRDNQRLNSNW
eukprot:TRINITY_DN68921_c0_g1_i3.p1 TRINITY_DN68921_c0_g1~~TRINITY_DN68921_c0_g1_i3.p1  ORF type:complete len:735 (+),score=104.85 TRINITY_DN68921_c0_g1_i3:264-2468(+)